MVSWDLFLVYQLSGIHKNVLRSLNKNNVRKFAEKERGVAAKKEEWHCNKRQEGHCREKEEGQCEKREEGHHGKKGEGHHGRRDIMETERRRGDHIKELPRTWPNICTSVLMIQQFLDTLISHCLASPLDSL